MNRQQSPSFRRQSRPFLIRWSFFYLAALVLRFASLSLFFIRLSPYGEVITKSPLVRLKMSLKLDIMVLFAVTLFFVISEILFKKQRWSRILSALAVVAGGLYLLLALVDMELMRWMGQRLSFDYFFTYLGTSTDSSLIYSIFLGDPVGFLLDVLVMVAWVLFSLFFLKQQSRQSAPCTLSRKLLPLPAVALAGTLFLLLHTVAGYDPIGRRWAEPTVLKLSHDARYLYANRGVPQHLSQSVRFLGGTSEADYPFWKAQENEEGELREFRQRPLEQRPDIVLIVIESLRGWVADTRDPENCALLPNLCKIAREGTFYPFGESPGFPTTEGILPLHLGVWPHPQRALATTPWTLRTRSLPALFRDAGYATAVLSAADPSFDNLAPWYSQWFDTTLYSPQINDDLKLAHQFADFYDRRNREQPLFLSWLSRTTHAPFYLSSDLSPEGNPENPDERYRHAAAIMDRAVGIVWDAIEKGTRKDQTILVIAGDHSAPTGEQLARVAELGGVHSAFTWTGMRWFGPQVPAGIINTSRASLIDVAPTLLGMTHLKVSHHFVGQDLFDSAENYPRFAIRLGEIARTSGETRLHTGIHSTSVTRKFSIDTSGYSPFDFLTEEKMPLLPEDLDTAGMMRDGLKAWEYLLNHNRLMPPPAK